MGGRDKAEGLTRGRGGGGCLLWDGDGDGETLWDDLPVADGTPGFVVVDVHGWDENKGRSLIKQRG